MKTKILLQLPLAITFLVILFTGCGKQFKGGAESLNFNEGKVIIGSLDWKEITDLAITSPLRKNGVPVAKITLPKGPERFSESRCTGFLINQNVIMTNHHCIPTRGSAVGVTAIFKLEKGIPKSAQKEYNCSTFYGNNKELDFALLKCDGNPGEVFGHLSLSDEVLVEGDQIYIIQQNCYYLGGDRNCQATKRYSVGEVTVVLSEYTHDADTLGGSSGSPMFSTRTNKVIGLHHAGHMTDRSGHGTENFAVRMDKIIEKIRSEFSYVDISDFSQDRGEYSEDAGNDLNSALEIELGTQVKNQRISDPSDIDVFTFITDNSKNNVQIELLFSHSVGDLDLFLINAQGELIAKSTGVKDRELIVKKLNKGRYFVAVKGYQGSMGDFLIKMQ